ncbi:MAG TPA: hypothetical protein VIH99_06295 [Bdellovibrionota bacterium]
MKWKNLALLIPLAALAGCGSIKAPLTKSTQAIKATGGGSATLIPLNDLSRECVGMNGRLTSNNSLCVVPNTVVLQSGATGYVPIDPDFQTGKFIVATGAPNGSVELTLSGRHAGDIPARMTITTPAGTTGNKLDYYVFGGSYKDVSVTVWTCYSGYHDQTGRLPRAICPDAAIPR